eukprot:3152259-Karenia_brevis.AAC.1
MWAAKRTAACQGSGGGAVLARKGTGIRPSTTGNAEEAAEHRVGLAWVDAVVRGGIHCMTIYLRDSE